MSAMGIFRQLSASQFAKLTSTVTVEESTLADATCG
jgi:hypothetical protein